MTMTYDAVCRKLNEYEKRQREGDSRIETRRAAAGMRKLKLDMERALAADADREMGLDPMAKGELPADSFGDHVEDETTLDVEVARADDADDQC